LGVARFPPFAGLFQHPVGNELANGAGSRAEAAASHKASVPRPKKKFVTPGVGAMLADGEQNLFVRQRGVRKFFVACPTNPFFGCGFEPTFTPRPSILSRNSRRYSSVEQRSRTPCFWCSRNHDSKPNQSAVRLQALESGRRVMRWPSPNPNIFVRFNRIA